MTAAIAAICLLAIATTVILASIKHIPEGQVYTARRVGRSTPRLLLPGTHLIVPLMEHIARKISLGGRILALDSDITDGGTVFWQVLDAARADTIIDRAEQSIREHIHAHAADVECETAAERGLRLKASLNDEFRPQGLLITRVTLHTATAPAPAGT